MTTLSYNEAMKTQLLVLAAGMGSRFGGVKQIESVGPRGETVLEYSVYDALKAGFDEIVFLIRSSIEADFRKTVLSRLPPRINFSLAFQETDSLLTRKELAAATGRRKPWGTGHALLCAASRLDAPFAVINADDSYGREALRIVRSQLCRLSPGSVEFCMAGYGLGNVMSPWGPVSRGICAVDPDGFLRGVTEHVSVLEEHGDFVSVGASGVRTILPSDAPVSMNLWGLTPAVFPLADGLFRDFLERQAGSADAEFYLPYIVDSLVKLDKVRVRVLPTREKHFGLTYRGDLSETRARITRMIAEGVYPDPLWGKTDLPL